MTARGHLGREGRLQHGGRPVGPCALDAPEPFGPVVLAPFWDLGFNKILRKNQVRLNSGRALELNKKFPQAGFQEQIGIIGPTQKMRSSTGIELQVMMPVVNAPFRFYWAYNPMRVQEYLKPPIVADRSLFPNYQSFIEAVRPGQAIEVPIPFAR